MRFFFFLVNFGEMEAILQDTSGGVVPKRPHRSVALTPVFWLNRKPGSYV